MSIQLQFDSEGENDVSENVRITSVKKFNNGKYIKNIQKEVESEINEQEQIQQFEKQSQYSYQQQQQLQQNAEQSNIPHQEIELQIQQTTLANHEQEEDKQLIKQEPQLQVELNRQQPLLSQNNIKKGKNQGLQRDEQGRQIRVEFSLTEHQMSVQEVADLYCTKIDLQNPDKSFGLTNEYAAQKLIEDGPNILSPPPDLPEFIKFLLQFTNFFMILLMVAGGLSFLAYGLDTAQPINMYAGIILFSLVFLNCLVSYIQENSAGDVMNKFKNMLPPQCKVIREGEVKQIKASDLVVGDIVKISTGDKTPADMRILMCRGLKVDQSSITGENEPIEITEICQSEHFQEARNLIFNSCLCQEGQAIGIVIRTGNNTFIGNIATNVTGTEEETSSLKLEIAHVVKFITKLAIVMGLVFFIIGVARGQKPLYVFINGFIIVIVANVPEGLPTTVTTILTVIARRLGARSVYIKKLECLETLGSATVIASDKTGTITQNKMTVENLWFNGVGYKADMILGKRDDFLRNKNFRKYYKVASLCNRSFIEREDESKKSKQQKEVEQKKKELEQAIEINKKEDQKFNKQSISDMIQKSASGMFQKLSSIIISPQRKAEINQLKELKIIGDPSEQAILRFSEGIKDTDSYRQKYQKIFEIPFNSKNKWQLSIHQNKNKKLLVLKGAPEIILAKCSSYYQSEKVNQIDENFRVQYDKMYTKFGKAGERVLGFAFIDLSNDGQNQYSLKEQNYPLQNLTFVGLISMIDPPKIGVDQAIATCKGAGIKVFMVTGDHPFTAEAIARKVKILEKEKTREEIARERGVDISQVDKKEAGAAIVYGPDMVKFSKEDWEDLVQNKKEIVFARITPLQKVEIVDNFQQNKEIVAVTGDGVNDAIALKKANIGIAMGIGGNDVAKEAANVIFMDDDFCSIIAGIEEGRLLFDNLMKTISYTLTHLIPEVIPILLNLGLSLPLGINSLLILTIDLGTEIVPAISLAYEGMESDIMQRKPRNAFKDRLVARNLLIYSYCIAGIVNFSFCIAAYFYVFSYYGISADDVFNSATDKWQIGGGSWTQPSNGKIWTEQQQLDILAQVQSAWYLTLVMGQSCHIYFQKTRKTSVFSHGFFKNQVTNFGVLLEVGIILIIIYVPALQSVFQTANPPPLAWTFWLGTFGILAIFNELKVYVARKYPNSCYAKWTFW